MRVGAVTWRLLAITVSNRSPGVLVVTSSEDGGVEKEHRYSQRRSSNKAVKDVGQLHLRMEAASQRCFRAAEIPLQVRH